MRRKFNGDTCCTCNAVCPMECTCTIGTWFPNVNGPDQFLVSDIVVPSSYRLWSAAYVYPCLNDGCGEFDPADPLGDAALIDVTPHNKIGYKTLGSFVLNKIGALGTSFCGWAADITGVPLAASKDDCWGLDALGAGRSVTDMCGGVTGGSDAAWSQNPVTATMNSGNLPTGVDWGQTHGLGNMYSGLRRIELISEGLANNGDPCGRPVLRLFPAEVWSPLSSRRWETQTGYCPAIDNPAVDGDPTDNGSGVVPVNLRYWDIDSFQVDAWNSPNLRGFVPSFDIQFEIPAATTSSYYLYFGQDIHCSIEGPVSVDMVEGSAFADQFGVDAGVCSDLTTTIPPDAVVNTYTGTDKVAASLDTSRGEMCECWGNPAGGAGCLPFPAAGAQPDESTLVTSLVLVSGGTTYTQNATSSWAGNAITIPTDNGTVTFTGDTRGTAGKGLGVEIGTAGIVFYDLDGCGVGITGTGPATETIAFNFPNGEDCTACQDQTLVYGCCELANGSVQITAGSASCTALGGTYGGNSSTCPPTGCCEISGSPNESGVTSAYCTTQGGTWTQDANCVTGWCASTTTGLVTAGVEEDECVGTWTATEPAVGCCEISGAANEPNVVEAYCTAQGGTWNEGVACVTGWCIDSTTGAVTAGIEEDECSGTWSATEPATGCCTISGTQNPDVAESWCTSQSGTFVAGACPFDPCGESYAATMNSFALEMNDPNFDLANPFYMYDGSYTQSTNALRRDVCSSFGAQLDASVVDAYGDNTAGPTQISVASNTDVKYNSTTGLWAVEAYVTWSHSGTTYTITASKSGISIPSAGCPTITVSGTFDTFSGNYEQYGGGNTFTVNDLVGSFNITLACE